MEKSNKPDRKNKYKVRRRKNKEVTKFFCEMCEKLIVDPKEIKTRKNYSHGKKSKASTTIEHRIDGGVCVVLKKKKKREL